MIFKVWSPNKTQVLTCQTVHHLQMHMKMSNLLEQLSIIVATSNGSLLPMRFRLAFSTPVAFHHHRHRHSAYQLGPLFLLYQSTLAPRRIKRVRNNVRPVCSTSSQVRPAEASTLYVVSTPIGHIGDMSRRAAHILQTVDMILAEDTRVTRTLMTLLSKTTSTPQSIVSSASVSSSSSPLRKSPTLLSCHDHNMQGRIPQILTYLSSGLSLALVCDAGTPCVSDPGYQVISAVTRAGHSVIPVPGPSALLAALAASAVPSNSFTFLGFLPRSGTDDARLQVIEQCAHTVILYEAPHRLRATLALLQGGDRRKVCDRPVTIAREVTKRYEEFLRFESVEQAKLYYDDVEPRGEFTLVLGPPPAKAATKADGEPGQNGLDQYDKYHQVNVKKLIEALVKMGVSTNSIAKSIASTSELPKKVVYTHANLVKQQLEQSEDEGEQGGDQR